MTDRAHAAPVAAVVDLVVRYGPVTAVSGVSLVVEAGAVVAVAGGDGAGKTSLLRAVLRRVAPAEGSVTAPVEERTGSAQAGTGLAGDLTVAETLAFAAAAYGIPGEQRAALAAALLDRTGLAPAADRLVAQLSGGMRQKLAIAAAVQHRPDLLVLDEPTTGVDPVSRAEVWRLIREEAARGAAVLLATTTSDEAARADHVVVLHAGTAQLAGRPAEVVAAIPGALGVALTPVGRHHWRHGRGWRIWAPDGVLPHGALAHRPDLEDAVVVAALAEQELAAPPLSTAPAERSSGNPARVAASTPGGGVPGGNDGGGWDPRLAAPPRWNTGGHGEGPLLAARGVVRRFGAATAVGGVDLEVGPGEVVGLLGANGAGKTTLVRMLLGLLRPSEGTVALFGEPPDRAARARVGYVPQTLGLYADLSVAENAALQRRVFRTPPIAVDPAIAPHMLVGDLPLGAQRRLAFALAAAHDPELLVLDEPTSGVGPLERARLWDVVRAAAEAGAGVLVTTHHLAEAEQCDRLVVMVQGRVAAAGALDAVVAGAVDLEARLLQLATAAA